MLDTLYNTEYVIKAMQKVKWEKLKIYMDKQKLADKAMRVRG